MNMISKYFIMFMIYSILGWLMEVIVTWPDSKKFVNRGFLIGPYCPVYGTGIVLITFLLNKYTDDIPVVFFLSILIFIMKTPYSKSLANHFSACSNTVPFLNCRNHCHDALITCLLAANTIY